MKLPTTVVHKIYWYRTCGRKQYYVSNFDSYIIFVSFTIRVDSNNNIIVPTTYWWYLNIKTKTNNIYLLRIFHWEDECLNIIIGELWEIRDNDVLKFI